MSVTSRRIAAARRAKSRLARLLAACDWVVGVGIVPEARGDLGLRVDVSPEAGDEVAGLPEEFEGMPVRVVPVLERRPR